MQKFMCDVCGLETKRYGLSTLYDWYQPDGVEDVCKDCNDKIIEVILRVDEAIKPIKNNWVKQFIINLKQRIKE